MRDERKSREYTIGKKMKGKENPLKQMNKTSRKWGKGTW